MEWLNGTPYGKLFVCGNINRTDLTPFDIFSWLFKWDDLKAHYEKNHKLPISGELYNWLLEQRDKTKTHPNYHAFLLDMITPTWKNEFEFASI